MKQLTDNRKYLLHLSSQAGDRHYDPETRTCLIARDTVWYAIALLFDRDADRRRLGNDLLATVRCEDATHTPATMLAILHEVPDLLGPGVAGILKDNIRNGLVRAADVQWRDGNVNHPLAAYCTLICGGEMTGEDYAVELGYNRLREFQAVVGNRRHRNRRQAEMSEYNSLTYTALDLWFLSIIAEHARHPGARALGRFLEERLWLDVAMHFHAPSQQFAGPHSRSYFDDSLGGFSALHCTMYAAFDDDLYLNPELAEKYNHISSLVQNSLVAILSYHVPGEAREMAWKKSLPLYFQKTTYAESYHENHGRFGFDNEMYPGGWSDLTTYQCEEFAMGSSATPYVNGGHSDCFMVRIRRARSINAMSDFRSMFTRGVFNDSLPGRKNFCHVTQSEIDESFLYEEGRCAVFQHRNQAIVSYSPKRSGHDRVKSFRVDLFCGSSGDFDDLRINGMQVQRFPSEYDAEAKIVFRDYRTYGVIIPLSLEPNPGGASVRVWKHNGLLMISLYNHDGQERNFSRDELSAWRNGFAIALVPQEDFHSFDAFISRAKDFRVEEHSPNGYIRDIAFSGPAGFMEFRYDGLRERTVTRRVNGRDVAINHMMIEAEAGTTGWVYPETLFGDEAFEDYA